MSWASTPPFGEMNFTGKGDLWGVGEFFGNLNLTFLQRWLMGCLGFKLILVNKCLIRRCCTKEPLEVTDIFILVFSKEVLNMNCCLLRWQRFYMKNLYFPGDHYCDWPTSWLTWFIDLQVYGDNLGAFIN